MDKVRNILNILFMLGAVAAVIVYFAIPDNRVIFYYVCGGAIFFKLMEFFIRFTR